MPRDGANVYTLPEAPFSPNTTALASRVNNNFADLGAAVSDSVCRSTETTAFTRTLLDDANAATARATLGVPWEMISRQTASNSASLVFTLPAGYTTFELLLEGLRPATNATNLQLRVSTDSGATFVSSAAAYSYGVSVPATTSTAYDEYSTAGTLIPLHLAAPNGAGTGVSGSFKIFGATSATRTTTIVGQTGYFRAGIQGGPQIVSGQRNASEANNAIQLTFATGNITDGSAVLMGLRA